MSVTPSNLTYGPLSYSILALDKDFPPMTTSSRIPKVFSRFLSYFKMVAYFPRIPSVSNLKTSNLTFVSCFGKNGTIFSSGFPLKNTYVSKPLYHGGFPSILISKSTSSRSFALAFITIALLALFPPEPPDYDLIGIDYDRSFLVDVKPL